ncbi:hypothetical protein ACFQ12_07095 [Methylobacterium trifolii]
MLKLVYAERLPYLRGEACRTATIAMPLKMSGRMGTAGKARKQWCG